MRKVEENNTNTHNVEKRKCVRNVHESRRWLSSSASGNGDSICACSQNCQSVKAERENQFPNPVCQRGALLCETVTCDAMISGFVSALFTVHFVKKKRPNKAFCREAIFSNCLQVYKILHF